jgi:hypothetical protein
MEREKGKSQTDMPARANHHQRAAQFATAVSKCIGRKVKA